MGSLTEEELHTYFDELGAPIVALDPQSVEAHHARERYCSECERLTRPNDEMSTAGNVLLGVSISSSLLGLALVAVRAAGDFAHDDLADDAMAVGAVSAAGVGVVSAAVGIPLVFVGTRRVPRTTPEGPEAAAEPEVVVRVNHDAATSTRVAVGLSLPF